MSRTFVTCSFPGPLTGSLAPKFDPLEACYGLVATDFVPHDFWSSIAFCGGGSRAAWRDNLLVMIDSQREL